MRILILTSRIPYPPHDGGNKAVAQTLNQFIDDKDCEVSLLSMNTSKHLVDVNSLPQIYSKLKLFETAYIDNQVGIVDALKSLFSNQSYILNRFISKEFSSKLKNIISQNQYDVIWMEGLFVTPYIDFIKISVDTPIFYRQHNIEYKIWERLASEEANILKKKYLYLQASLLKKYEVNLIKKTNVIIPISPIDEQYNLDVLNIRNASFLHPYGVTIPEEVINVLPMHRKKIFHIGAMDWLPNQDGIDWFLSYVWPKVINQIPDATFHFAGRNMPKRYGRIKIKGVYCDGEVENAHEWSSDKGILVVPVLAASGIRIKTIEAMLHMKPVVSTTVGAAGIKIENGKNIFLADDPEQMAQKIIMLIEHQELYANIAKHAYDNVVNNYEKNALFHTMKSFISRYIHA